MSEATVIDQSLNICTEIVKSMRRLEFRESSIEAFTGTPGFIEADTMIKGIEDFDTVGVITDDLLVQKGLVVVMFNLLFSQLEQYPPANIRRLLNITQAPDELVVLLDQLILPFVKGYENDYFPQVQ